MTKSLKLAGGLALALALLAQPLTAQTRKPAAAPAPAGGISGPIVPGLGVANLDAAIVNSNAFQAAEQQRMAVYKPVADQYNARAAQLQAQLKQMVDKFTADRNAKQPDAVLQQEYVDIQKFQASAKDELEQIRMPITMSEAYVVEQITDKLEQAVQNAMKKRGITILLAPGAVIARSNAYELTPAIIQELNILIPTAQITPPAGWLPRELREQQAQQQGTPQAAPAPRPVQPTPTRPGTAPAIKPAGPQPEGR